MYISVLVGIRDILYHMIAQPAAPTARAAPPTTRAPLTPISTTSLTTSTPAPTTAAATWTTRSCATCTLSNLRRSDARGLRVMIASSSRARSHLPYWAVAIQGRSGPHTHTPLPACPPLRRPRPPLDPNPNPHTSARAPAPLEVPHAREHRRAAPHHIIHRLEHADLRQSRRISRRIMSELRGEALREPADLRRAAGEDNRPEQ